MYLRRHCYDKPHKCPGRNGGGFKYPVHPKGTPEPPWYRELREEGPGCDPWERSNHVQRHWWQQLERCDRGMIYMPQNDPWRNWRFHRCNRCDVLALPIVTQYLDPKWLYIEAKDFFRYSWFFYALLNHKRRWIVDAEHRVPWWSLPHAVWREFRSKALSWEDWFVRLYQWYRHPSAREKDGWRQEWLDMGKDR